MTTVVIPDDVAAAVAHLNKVQPRFYCGGTITLAQQARLRNAVAILCEWVGDDPERAEIVAEAIA